MSREDRGDLDREKMRRVAADIAERISAGSGARLEQLSGRRVCPPNRLCCWEGYACSQPFYCDVYFGCIDRFTASSHARYPDAVETLNNGGNHGR